MPNKKPVKESRILKSPGCAEGVYSGAQGRGEHAAGEGQRCEVDQEVWGRGSR